MTLFLYDFLQPIAVLLFRVTVFFLRFTGTDRASKLIQTLEIRKSNGRPAFEMVQVEKFHGKRPIWIHAASGEFEYAKPVVRNLHQQGIPVFVTYFSPTYQRNVESFPGVTASCALPLENRRELRRMIQKVNPSALIIARTDTWPNMVRESFNAKVPILLFSATFYEGSKRISLFARSLTKATYHYIDEIQCVNKDDLRILSEFGFRRSVVRGDTRYDQVLARLDQTKGNIEKKLPETLKASLRSLVLVAGSVWEEDVEALIPAINLAKEAVEKNELTTVLVPHEISPRLIHFIQEKAGLHGLSTAVLSELVDNPDRANGQECDLLIVDRVGILAELYLVGQLAFVGGSFRKTVHSVMEPLAAGCLTFVGPRHRNNREAIEFQTEKASQDFAAVLAANNSEDLSNKLLSTLKKFKILSASDRNAIRDRIQSQVRFRGGATDAVIEWINRVQK